MAKAESKDTSLYNSTFSDYWKAGLAVIPERDGKPQVNGQYIAWSKFYQVNYKPTDEEIFEWDMASDVGMGLVTGAPSNIVALDIDNATEDQIKRVIEIIGDSPCKKFGSKGVSLFFRYNNERNENWTKNGIILVELLSTGRKTTIPPTIHRKTGKPYVWKGKSLLESYKDLPILPTDYSEKLCAIFSIIKEPHRDHPTHSYDMKPSYDEAVNALSYCDPNSSRDEWIKIGMAFKTEVGDAGFQDFDKWSARGKAYDKKTIWGQWRSLDARSIGYGTLVYYAKQGGYIPPKPDRDTITKIVTIDVDDWEKRKLEEIAKRVKESEILPDFYTNAPHHVKSICEWICKTSYYPQPIITLGSVISMLGFVMGKDCDFMGLKPNLYIANLAGTGDGKEHILRCIRGIFDVMSLRKHRSEKWTSDTAIVAKLQTCEGYCCYIVDEMYTTMKALAQKSGNIREIAAASTILQGYTGVELSTADYADRKEKETIIIKKPFISLLGYSTPEPFFEAIGITEAFTGLIGRMTVFQGSRYLPEPNENHDTRAWEKVPSDIIECLNQIKRNSRSESYKNGFVMYGHKSIPATPEAKQLLRETELKIRDRRNILKDENPQMEKVIVRIFEMMKKYAMIASKGIEVEVEHVEWAKAVAEYNLGLIMDASSNFVDSKFQREVNRAYQYMLKNAVNSLIEKSEFTNGCRFESRQDRENIIAELIDGNRITVVAGDNSTGRRKTYYKIL